MITSLIGTTIWKWIEGYFELGFIKNKKFVHEYHWGSGLSLNIIPDFFEIHFPIMIIRFNLQKALLFQEN